MCTWNFEYYGSRSAHKVLLQATDKLYNLDQHKNYAKNIPFAQSSGIGKSKTMEKVATEQIPLPMCPHEDTGEKHFGL